ncbi:putative secologanin synthase [Helianthus debilis subsp. tardiflorus]
METMGKVAMAIVALVIMRWGWKLLNWVWLKPKRLEKWLRDEGYNSNSCRLLIGDMIELATMMKEGKSKPIPVTHDISIGRVAMHVTMWMETMGKVAMAIVALVIMRWGWKLLNWVWLKPKRLEKWLRDEGYNSNSCRLLIGDMIELATMMKEGKSKPIPVTHDITSYALPFDHHMVSKYGDKSFIWFGPKPRMYIMDPELIKEILLRSDEFKKPYPEPFRDSLIGGLFVTEGHKWIKHRKIITPAFNLQNIKIMFSAISSSCSNMIHKWELLTAGVGSSEIDVWPYIINLAGDVISQTAFGSSYEEGQKIF